MFIDQRRVSRADTMKDDEIEKLYSELESAYGALTYEAWLALLVSLAL